MLFSKLLHMLLPLSSVNLRVKQDAKNRSTVAGGPKQQGGKATGGIGKYHENYGVCKRCENSSLQVSKRLHEDGVKGAAVAGGAALALGGLVGLGLAIAKAVRKRGERREEE